MRKAWIFLVVLWSFGGASKAYAFDIYGLFQGLYSAVCVEVPINLGVITVKIPPLTSVADLRSFCRTYNTLMGLNGYDRFLEGLARSSLGALAQSVVNGIVEGLGASLRADPAYQNFVDSVSDALNKMGSAVAHLYNLPYAASRAISGAAYEAAYSAVYDSLRSKAEASLASLTVDASDVIPRLSQSEAVEGLGEEYQDPSLTPDPTRVDEANTRAEEIENLVAEIGKGQAEAEALAAAREAARVQAERTTEEAKRSAEQRLLQEESKKQADILRSLNELAAQVAANPRSMLPPAPGPGGGGGSPPSGGSAPPAPPSAGGGGTVSVPGIELGVAPKFVEEARNAPSDRRLLELQVEALASLMEQQAAYVTKTAELIVQTSKQQVLSTQQVVEAIREQKREAERVAMMLDPEVVARSYELELKRRDPAIEQIEGALYLLCSFYSGGDDSYCK